MVYGIRFTSLPGQPAEAGHRLIHSFIIIFPINRQLFAAYMAVCQNLVPLVNIKIAGK